MRVLVLHNQYQYRGGEDTVFVSEIELLRKYGNSVRSLVFSNDSIVEISGKMKYGIRSFYNSKSAKLLEKEIRRFSPEIIHVHNFFPIASPSVFFIANRFKIPVILTLHNYRLLCPNAMFFRNGVVCEKCIDKTFPIDGVVNGCYRNSKIQTFSLATMVWVHKLAGTWNKRIDKFIVLTKFAKNKFINSSLTLPNSKICIKSNFVSDNGFVFDKENYFLFVGRLSEEKGIDILMNAFKDSKNKLEIVGDGPLENEVRTFSENFHNVTFHGFQKKDFIYNKLKKAKALIFTSKLYEGMPMTIIEAFSVGTPVISGNIGGPGEIVKDSYNGLLYEVGNFMDLKNKINWLNEHPLEVMDMNENARREYESHYSEEENYKQLKRIYKDAINEKKESIK